MIPSADIIAIPVPTNSRQSTDATVLPCTRAKIFQKTGMEVATVGNNRGAYCRNRRKVVKKYLKRRVRPIADCVNLGYGYIKKNCPKFQVTMYTNGFIASWLTT